MSVSSGTSRYTTDWESAELTQIPWIDKTRRKAIADGFLESWELLKQIDKARQNSLDSIESLGIESEESIKRFRAYQAPK